MIMIVSNVVIVVPMAIQKELCRCHVFHVAVWFSHVIRLRTPHGVVNQDHL